MTSNTRGPEIGADVATVSQPIWINRFLMRLDQLETGLPILGAVSFALKKYTANPESSPEEAAEIYVRTRPL